jgi:hypothetical protein
MFELKPNINEISLSKLRSLPLPAIEKLHRKYGIDFVINDGQLVGITGVTVGFDYGSGADMTALCPAAL